MIICLIQQDLKHNQLTGGLRRLGLDTSLHNLEIIDIVAELMGVEEVSDKWVEIYVGFLEQANKYEISDNGKELLPVASECYKQLLSCWNMEEK